MMRAIYSLLLIACSAGAQPKPPPKQQVSPEKIVAEYQKDLLQRLMATLSTKGSQIAISTCGTHADEVSAAYFKRHGILIGRTSTKLRNHKNAPRTWVKPLLSQYEKAFYQSPKRQVLAAKQVRIDQARLGYVAPIRVKGLCLKCHGKQLEASVTAQLKADYPFDKATGYEIADFRGLVWMEWSR